MDDKDIKTSDMGQGPDSSIDATEDRAGMGEAEVIEAEFVELSEEAVETGPEGEPEVLEVEAEIVEAEVEAVKDWQDLVKAVEEEPAPANDPVVRLVHEYKEAVKARDGWEDRYLRAAADYANAKRRAEMRADNLIWEARERVLSGVLPVLDDFERAFAALPEDEQQSTWSEGFDLIYRKLRGVLEREGISEIEAEGQPFDPALHQAVISEPTDGIEPGTVLEVLQKGYLLGDRVLRPSMVKVAG
jgi:molecular chaperone GrpE